MGQYFLVVILGERVKISLLFVETLGKSWQWGGGARQESFANRKRSEVLHSYEMIYFFVVVEFGVLFGKDFFAVFLRHG